MSVLFPIKKRLLIAVALIVVTTITILSYATDSSNNSLSIEPISATYRYRDTGDFFKIVFAIVNSGDAEVTVITEHLDCSFIGNDRDPNLLRCVLSFDAEIKYKKKHLIVPSIYKYAPVTLRPGEATMVIYYQDYSKSLNSKGMSETSLKADNIAVSYKVSSFWAKRFGLWHGELRSSPIIFRKVE